MVIKYSSDGLKVLVNFVGESHQYDEWVDIHGDKIQQVPSLQEAMNSAAIAQRGENSRRCHRGEGARQAQPQE